MASTPRKTSVKTQSPQESFSAGEDAASAVAQSALSSEDSNPSFPSELTSPIREAAAQAREATSQIGEVTSQISESFRSTIEKGLAQTRSAYEKAKTAAEENAGAVEASFGAAKAGAISFNEKALDAARAQFEANVAFLKSALGARTFGELVALQSEFTRKQVEALNAQVKEFGALAQKVFADASEPLKTRLAEAFDVAA